MTMRRLISNEPKPTRYCASCGLAASRPRSEPRVPKAQCDSCGPAAKEARRLEAEIKAAADETRRLLDREAAHAKNGGGK